MKRYTDYMDSLEVSDTLHEKLKNLEEPKKKPRPWARYGAAAAALVLMAGAAAWGLSRGQGGWGALMESFRPASEVAPENAEIPAPFPNPDIAFEDDPYAPANRTGGGYEVRFGEGPDSMVAYYLLPYLEWADASALSQASMDYVLAPLDAVQRDATWDDVQIFAGGEKAMADHLLWDEGMNWSGTLWFLEDGTPCAAALNTGYVNWGYGFRLSLEVMYGSEVPSCVVLPAEYYETSQWQGVKITALKNGGYMVDDDGLKLTEKREVSFYSNMTGYKLTLYAHDADRADELCARFVRYAVDGGFHLYALSYEPAYDEDMPIEAGGLPNKGIPPENVPGVDILHPGDEGYIEPFPVPDEDGAAQTRPYDPNAGFDPDCPYCADGTAHAHPNDPGAYN